MTDLEPITVSTPRFTTNHPQVWYDGWRGRERTMRYGGKCVVCHRRIYAFDDGENDPRGVLGDHAASPIHPEDFDRDPSLPSVPVCFLCMNEEPKYRKAVETAERLWKEFN